MVTWFTKPSWLFSEDGETVAIAELVANEDGYAKFVATPDGRALLDCVYSEWKRIFMD